MEIYNSTTSSLATQDSIAVLFGTEYLLEIYHSDTKGILKINRFSINEWKGGSQPFKVWLLPHHFTILPKSIVSAELLQKPDLFLTKEKQFEESNFSDFTLLFDKTSLQNTEHSIVVSQDHLATKVIEKTIYSSKKDEAKLAIAIWDQSVLLTLVINEELINCNSFECTDVSEALYYTMLYIQEYDLDAESINCQLYGDFNAEGHFRTEITQYLRNVNINRMGIVPQADIDGILALTFDQI